jgi:hypothetical protein
MFEQMKCTANRWEFLGAIAAAKEAYALAVFVAVLCLGSMFVMEACAAQGKPRQIRIEYVAPKDPAHQPIYDRLKEGGALEHVQELLSPLRLPYPLRLKVAGCDGIRNAWYEDEVITVCYELLDSFVKGAPERDLPIGIASSDTIVGPALDTFLHETGHAVFDLLQIPVLGREEDAADQFSAYILLRLGKEEARRMILGAAYGYKLSIPGPELTVPIQMFADEHSAPAQRLFNILCLAYGADQKLFVDIVEKGLLPKGRADGCVTEYEDLSFSLKALIGPHIDKRLAKHFHRAWARDAAARRARWSRR